jgi:hypothetical protein
LQVDADQVEARESDTIYERDNIKYNKEKSLSELESKATERTNEVNSLKCERIPRKYNINDIVGHFYIQSERRPKTTFGRYIHFVLERTEY